jgi:hypothetical protein
VQGHLYGVAAVRGYRPDLRSAVEGEDAIRSRKLHRVGNPRLEAGDQGRCEPRFVTEGSEQGVIDIDGLAGLPQRRTASPPMKQ